MTKQVGGKRKKPTNKTNKVDETPLEEAFGTDEPTLTQVEEVKNEPKIEPTSEQVKETAKTKHEPVPKGEYKYQNIPVSIPVNLNRALTSFINEQKEEGFKLFDKKTGTYKLVSKSSWIQYLVERELKKEGWDKKYEF